MRVGVVWSWGRGFGIGFRSFEESTWRKVGRMWLFLVGEV